MGTAAGAAPEWSVMGIFYEAVHWVEAFLAMKGAHSGSHADRRKWFGIYSELSPIKVDFEMLKTECDNARYQCYRHTEQDIRTDIVPVLEKVRATISPYLTP
jgi:hypothetical protein